MGLLISIIQNGLAFADTLERETIKNINAVNSLFIQKKYSEARLILDRLRKKPNPPNQVIFLSGVIYYHQSDYDQAVKEFRLLLTRDPKLLRPRLELARTLFMMRNYESSKYHFEQVLGNQLPNPVKINIINFLRAITERKPRYSFSIGLISDSNPGQQTDSETVEIGGLIFSLSDSARSKPSVGLSIMADGKFPFAESPLYFGKLGMGSEAYNNSDLSKSNFSGVLGKHYSLQSQTVTLEGGVHLTQYGGENLYSGELVSISDNIRSSPNTSWNLSMEVKRLDYINHELMDGWNYSFKVDSIYTPSTETRIEYGLSTIDSKTKDPSYSYFLSAIFGSYRSEFAGGLIAKGTVQYLQTKYAGIDPLFGISRDESESKLELELIKRNWQVFGMASRLVVGHAKHWANIDLYSFNRSFIQIGLTTSY